jgi:putative oxidoreductase
MQTKIHTVIRYLFGAGMTFFGLANLFQLMPPHSFPGNAGILMTAFADSGYILPAVGLTQLILGIALVTNRFIPLALLAFAPIVVNVILFHVFMDMASLPMALPVVAATGYLFFYNRVAFRQLLKANQNEII